MILEKKTNCSISNMKNIYLYLSVALKSTRLLIKTDILTFRRIEVMIFHNASVLTAFPVTYYP